MEISCSQVLNPPYFNLAEAKKITVTSTCGEQNGRPIRELYCSLAGATRYSPYEGYYSYNYEDDLVSLRAPGENPTSLENRKPMLHASEGQSLGGQNCEYCDAANPELRHPAEYMVDGTPRYWQSPPLSRGMDYNKVNITIDLEQAISFRMRPPLRTAELPGSPCLNFNVSSQCSAW
ncbi:hypothetical protein D918_09431 [Trichuris suis]|nr:hypothetical protein D918_09431 [Trichuris suis]